jgi:hypothetical protein
MIKILEAVAAGWETGGLQIHCKGGCRQGKEVELALPWEAAEISGKARVRSRNRFPALQISRRLRNILHNTCRPAVWGSRTWDERTYCLDLRPFAYPAFLSGLNELMLGLQAEIVKSKSTGMNPTAAVKAPGEPGWFVACRQGLRSLVCRSEPDVLRRQY